MILLCERMDLIQSIMSLSFIVLFYDYIDVELWMQSAIYPVFNESTAYFFFFFRLHRQTEAMNDIISTSPTHAHAQHNLTLFAMNIDCTFGRKHNDNTMKINRKPDYTLYV